MEENLVYPKSSISNPVHSPVYPKSSISKVQSIQSPVYPKSSIPNPVPSPVYLKFSPKSSLSKSSLSIVQYIQSSVQYIQSLVYSKSSLSKVQSIQSPVYPKFSLSKVQYTQPSPKSSISKVQHKVQSIIKSSLSIVQSKVQYIQSLVYPKYSISIPVLSPVYLKFQFKVQYVYQSEQIEFLSFTSHTVYRHTNLHSCT